MAMKISVKLGSMAYGVKEGKKSCGSVRLECSAVVGKRGRSCRKVGNAIGRTVAAAERSLRGDGWTKRASGEWWCPGCSGKKKKS